MEGRVATVLVLMVSLVAAAAAARVDTIRLPSRADELTANAGDQERPWKCCTRSLCMRVFPPICRCYDVVERCSGACKDCQAAEREDASDPKGYVCHARYQGDPGPQCGGGAAHHNINADVVFASAADEAMMAAAAEKKKEKRPWKCCDLALCTKSAPPTCSCMDKVESCGGSGCKFCGPSETDPSGSLFCWDRYNGWPGPKCTNATGGP